MLTHAKMGLLLSILTVAHTKSMYFPSITDNQFKLTQAIYNNDIETIKTLVKKTELSQNGFASPALHQAVIHEKYEIVTLLLQAGAHVDCISYTGETALCKAARTGNLTSARLLKEAGANVNFLTPSGDTPLLYALKGFPEMPINKQIAMIAWLIDQGAEIAPQTNQLQLNTLMEKLKERLETQTASSNPCSYYLNSLHH